MMNTQILAVAVATTLFAPAALAHEGEDYKPRIDDHAPIGVMADHYHKAGEWMASARWMTMGMNDPANIMMGPQDMDMSMAMVGVMYAPTDWVTLAAGMGFSDRSMDMIMGGMPMERSASGVTDLKLNAIFPLSTTDSSRLLFKAGVILPTGATSETDAMGNLVPLAMQPGNNSWALTPSATYSLFGNDWSTGLQASATIWLDDASTGEKPGNIWQATAWISKTLTENWSLSTRLSYEDMGAAKGANPMSGSARERLRAYVGTNLYVVGTHRIGIEFGLPLWEDRGTNNLETGTSLMLGWQKAF
ncbi:MAG: transporter [Alphaproteobacteria bacterium]|nr:transporter [Alphaproteobacteria bacterium]